MRIKTTWFLIIALTLASVASVTVALPSEKQLLNPTADNPPTIIPSPPNIDAKAYVLMDANSGKVLAAKNPHQKKPPASLTKLMTLYIVSTALVQQQITQDDKVPISRNAWKTGGSRMFVKQGNNVRVKDLIKGIIVASGNDACVAIAEYLAGNQTNFAKLMNNMADRLNMNNTHYVDATGLPKPNHYSTAYDLALLARAIIHDYPQYYGWYQQKWITWNNIKQPNRNRLLWRDEKVDGLKTGHTDAAGYCLIASKQQQGMRLISVVLGSLSERSRANASQVLLNWGFRFFRTQKLFSQDQIVTTPRVWMGQHKNTPLGVKQDLYITIPKGQYRDVKATITLQPKLKAPLKKDDRYGTLTVTLHNEPITKVPLVALQNNPKGGFFSYLRDRLLMIFE